MSDSRTSSTPFFDQRLVNASQTLEVAMQSVRPEDFDATAKLFSPIESVVAGLPAPPLVPEGTGGKILTLLWNKTHPGDADLMSVVSLLGDPSSMVRLNAIEALRAILDRRGELTDSAAVTVARETIQYVSRTETSPLLVGQLADLSDRLGKVSRPRRRTRQRVQANPYTAGPPIRSAKHFFGREDILTEIGKQVSSGGRTRAVVLYGARRTGKTSLLYRIADGALGTSAVPVYLDMQGLAGSPLQSLLRVLLRVTWQALGEESDYLPSTAPDFAELREYFDNALSRLGNRSLVLMLDEYEVLESFLATGLGPQLLSLLESAPNLFVIFAGSRKLEAISDEAFGSLLSLAKYIKITFLERADAIRLIREPAEGMLDFGPDVPELIMELTNGHPFYTQLLCQAVFEIAAGRREVSRADVDEAVKRFLTNPAPHLVLSWNNLRAGEAAVGSVVAVLQQETGQAVEPAAIVSRLRAERFPVPMNLAAVQRQLTALVNTDWVVKKERSYRFTMELVRRWVADERPIASLTAKQERDLASRAASFWRQRCAWALDVVISIVLALVAGGMGAATAGGLTGAVWATMLVFVYVSAALRFGEATLGMKAFRVQVAPAPGRSIGTGRCAWVAALYTFRVYIALTIVSFFVLVFSLIFDRSLLPSTAEIVLLLLLGFVALVTEVVDTWMIWRGERRQGLWDKLGGIVVVPTEAFRL
jgi:hypothetical protein